MRIKNFASGSSGNATYIGTDHTHILVDSGISRKRIREGLHEIGLDLSDLDAVLITHEHIDHIQSLGVLERTTEIPVYATEGTVRGILDYTQLGAMPGDIFRTVHAREDFTIGDITVRPLEIPHDANEPVCYRLNADGHSFAVVTDLGEYDNALVSELQGLNGILLEANHDVRMLELGSYPYPVKQRILGRYGHLSNENSGRFLSEVLNDQIRHVILGHLSRHNNTRDLARMSVALEIDMAENDYTSSDFDIQIAMQDRALDTMEV